MAAGRAVVEGLLKEEDVPEEVWPYIENGMQFHRSMLDEDIEAVDI